MSNAINVLLERARSFLQQTEHPLDALSMIGELVDTLADKCNENITSCGTQHLAAERALRIVERHGWPHGDAIDALNWLHAVASEAGQTQNREALNRLTDEDLPF